MAESTNVEFAVEPNGHDAKFVDEMERHIAEFATADDHIDSSIFDSLDLAFETALLSFAELHQFVGRFDEHGSLEEWRNFLLASRFQNDDYISTEQRFYLGFSGCGIDSAAVNSNFSLLFLRDSSFNLPLENHAVDGFGIEKSGSLEKRKSESKNSRSDDRWHSDDFIHQDTQIYQDLANADVVHVESSFFGEDGNWKINYWFTY